MPTNKNAIIRYLTIDKRLRKLPRPSFADLVQACSEAIGKPVSRSSIEKDIKDMRYGDVLGKKAPIVNDRRANCYYYSDESFQFYTNDLDEEEQIAMAISAQAIAQQLPSASFGQRLVSILKQSSSKQKKLQAMIQQGEEFLQLEVPFQYSQQGDQQNNDYRHLETVFNAIYEEHYLDIEYRKFGTEAVQTHCICPLLLKEYRNRWYVIGVEVGVDPPKFKNWGLDRMVSCYKRTNGFSRSAFCFSAQDFFQHAIGITVPDNQQPALVRLRFDATQYEYLQTRPIHHSQRVIYQPVAPYFELEINVYLTYELEERLLGYAQLVEVLEPLSLRQALHQRLIDTLNKYQ
jgi:predicted DNA-binding transcriptional regulator YafY